MEERELDPVPGIDPQADERQAVAFSQWEHATPPVAWWRRRPLQVGAAVVLVLVVGIAVWLVSGTSGNAPASAPSPSATPLLIEGTLDLSFGTTFSPNASDPKVSGMANPTVGDPCIALGGYDDITQGAAVTIGDGAGKTLVVTALSAGAVAGDANQALCEFSFTVTVPPGHGTYTVTISHRGTQVFSESQIQQPITLSLGS